MNEIVANIHMHTKYSDGQGSHDDIVKAALKSGLDAVIVTDHNVWVNGPQGYYRDGDRQVLMLIGEEVHDQARDPQKNHLLVLNTNQEMASYAPDPQELLNVIKREGGLAFLAHPFDPPAPAISEGDLSWVDWEVHGYTGIELWNAMTEMKSLIRSKLHAIFYAFNPSQVAHGPFPETLRKWDELLASGQRVVALGGSDAHAFRHNMGPIKRVIFPYGFHFRAVNTHILLDNELSGDESEDRHVIYGAISKGHAFIGYDLPASTRGFRFMAHGKEKGAWMGDSLSAYMGVTFQIHLPVATECHLIKDGERIKTWRKRENCTYITADPGIYRVEVYIQYLGKRRGWIFSNPIYVVED